MITTYTSIKPKGKQSDPFLILPFLPILPICTQNTSATAQKDIQERENENPRFYTAKLEGNPNPTRKKAINKKKKEEKRGGRFTRTGRFKPEHVPQLRL